MKTLNKPHAMGKRRLNTELKIVKCRLICILEITIKAFLSIPVGIRYMILSAFAFSIMALFVKLVGDHGVPVLETVAARSVVSLVISYVGLRREGVALLGTRKGLLAARGLTGFVALICVFYAITHLPLAETMVLQYLHPMFTALLAFFFKRAAKDGNGSLYFFKFFGRLAYLAT